MSRYDDPDFRDEMREEAAYDEALASMVDEAHERVIRSTLEEILGGSKAELITGDQLNRLISTVKSNLDYLSERDDQTDIPAYQPEEDEDEKSSYSVDSQLKFMFEIALTEYIALAEKISALEKALSATPDDEELAGQLHMYIEAQSEQGINLEAMKMNWLSRVEARNSRTRLRDLIRNRRELLGMTREIVASKAGVSVSTIKNLETSNDPDREWSHKTKRAVEDALAWDQGSFDSILDGGNPVELATFNTIDQALRDRKEMPQQAYGLVPVSQAGAEGNRVPVYLEPRIVQALEKVSIAEGQTIDATMEQVLMHFIQTKWLQS